ncbi:CBS domain-containing protein [Streptomyces sp. NPDC050703]|uniref:CBS domain-containing protein n=1 Tax=Streptomyces sp. NPDC050703 TaxID=3157218 RepID=UPI003442F786
MSGAVAEAMDEAGPRVWKDMTVEVALSVMAGARVGYLLVCDEDGHRTGLVTRAGLTAVRDGAGYTDRVRLRDVIDGRGPDAVHLAASGAGRTAGPATSRLAPTPSLCEVSCAV